MDAIMKEDEVGSWDEAGHLRSSWTNLKGWKQIASMLKIELKKIPDMGTPVLAIKDG